MHTSVELGFDPESEARLRALCEELACIYAGPRPLEAGVVPHISLTSFPDGPPSWLEAALTHLADTTPAFPVLLDSVACFPSSEGIIYLSPQRSPALLACHRALHELLRPHPDRRHPYYEPERWIPHCTVASGVPEHLRERVATFAGQAAGTAARVESVVAKAYPPAREISSRLLRGGRTSSGELHPALGRSRRGPPSEAS